MPPTRYLSAELSGLLGFVAVSGVFSLVVALATRRERYSAATRIRDRLVVFIALLVVSIGVGYATRGEGFDDAAAGIDSALGLRQSPSIGVDELAEAVRQGATLIDCRYSQDFDRGTIDGAINLPIDIGLGEFKHVLAAIDRSADLIVFCQSRGCGFSGYMATMLAGAGYQNVSIYKGGYEEWRAYDRSR
jgi:rhodanese-related sulfurtransferase